MRDMVFISYAHEDQDVFEKLRSHLKAFKSNRQILAWSDQSIGPGDAWSARIKFAISRTQAAILLVSRHFFASEFIREHGATARNGNKVRLALGTAPAWRLNDTSVKALCHRADLDAIGCSAVRLSYLFRLGKCSPLSPPKPTVTESAG